VVNRFDKSRVVRVLGKIDERKGKLALTVLQEMFSF
jgi:hypothetical protein